MTRKDIIIIAVLVNAGLLAILFMMAVNSDDDRISDPVEAVQTLEIKPNESIFVEKTGELSSQAPVIASGEPIDSSSQMLTTGSANEMAFEQYLEPEDDELPLKAEQVVEATPSKQHVQEEAVSASHFAEITVKRGDSLDKIARANGTTVQVLKETNKLKNDRLNIGQVLKVPSGQKKKHAEPAKATGKTIASASPSAGGHEPQYHTIKSGDNPWKIAKQFNLKLDELLKLNHLDEDKARKLKDGDKIRVR